MVTQESIKGMRCVRYKKVNGKRRCAEFRKK